METLEKATSSSRNIYRNPTETFPLWVPRLRATYSMELEDNWDSIMNGRGCLNGASLDNYIKAARNAYKYVIYPDHYFEPTESDHNHGVCQITGCCRPSTARGVCHFHYLRINNNNVELTKTINSVYHGPSNNSCIRCGRADSAFACNNCYRMINIRVQRVALYFLKGEYHNGL